MNLFYQLMIPRDEPIAVSGPIMQVTLYHLQLFKTSNIS